MKFITPAIVSALLSSVVSSEEAPAVTLANGTYYGVHQPTYDQDLFLGMPFAQPPVGDLRFRNPAPLNETWSEPRAATEYSPECYGYGSDQWVLGNVVSEDCLTLNVIRPSGVETGANLPVAVWIHGGAFVMGGSMDPRYNMSFMVDQSVQMDKPMIGVSINYRLQAFGYIWGSEVEKAGVANLALKDQRLALHWVQENIASFGGDPRKVTVFGESAGAFSIGYQLIAYGGRDDNLFRAAIMESGAAASGEASYTSASEWDVYFNNITDAANCSSADDALDCLRQVPIEALNDILNSSVTADAEFRTQIDNDFVQDAGIKLLDNGQFVHVPIMQGANHDEGASFGPKGINTTEHFANFLTASGNSAEQVAILTELYPDIPEIGIPGTLDGRPVGTPYGDMYKRSCAYVGDNMMHAPRRYTAKTWSANNVTNYNYNWNVRVNDLSEYQGAGHFQEVAFVFYNIDGIGYQNAVAKNPFEGMPETYEQLARMMSRMWISFFADMTPNNNGVSAVEWPEYTTEDPQIIFFDTNVTDLAYTDYDLYRAEAIDYIFDTLH